jgi:hypothetical protein
MKCFFCFSLFSLSIYLPLSITLSLALFLWCSLFLNHTISIHNVLVVATPMKCLCPEQIERREGRERYRDKRTVPFSSPQGSWPSVQDGSLCGSSITADYNGSNQWMSNNQLALNTHYHSLSLSFSFCHSLSTQDSKTSSCTSKTTHAVHTHIEGYFLITLLTLTPRFFT